MDAIRSDGKRCNCPQLKNIAYRREEQ
ncbi:hypothetical protein EG68_12352, partial [Paragonimus skrjabini miyazakii]